MTKANQSTPPFLQIIHITDLHTSRTLESGTTALRKQIAAQKGKLTSTHLALLIQRMIERSNAWDDGTRRAYKDGPRQFEKFLRKTWVPSTQRWWGRDADKIPAWIVDTGDRTTFGDHDSICDGALYVEAFRNVFHAAKVRTLYGNHDAWPGTFPLHATIGDFGFAEMRRFVHGMVGWNPAEWIEQPLTVQAPGSGASIDLYALDSVVWHALVNLTAMGHISSKDLDRMRDVIRQRLAVHPRQLRIVATHHPISYPYTYLERFKGGVVPSMRIAPFGKIPQALSNDADNPQGIGPLAHLILSGHTHASYPGEELNRSVQAVHQEHMRSTQMQIVTGSLMLPPGPTPSPREDRNDDPTLEMRREKSGAVHAVNHASCQAQILCFHEVPGDPDAIVMVRRLVRAVVGSTDYLLTDRDYVELRLD